LAKDEWKKYVTTGLPLGGFVGSSQQQNNWEEVKESTRKLGRKLVAFISE